MANIAVIGAGPMGLAAGLQLLKDGHDVTIFEADKVVGGMSASFLFDGLKIERYYHFICKSDHPLFDLLAELGIVHKLKWVPTKMGYFYQNRLNDWGDPVALLKFNGLGLVAKIRYGLMAFISTKRKSWQRLDSVDAVSWIKRWIGDEAYSILWKPLFDLKFHHYTPNLSAAWIWARLRRVGTSRKNIFQEQMGYLEGGSDTFLEAIERKIIALGGCIRLSSPITKVHLANDRVTGVQVAAVREHFDAVVSTIPLPYVADLVPDLPEAVLNKYRSVENIAVVCVLAKLRLPLSKYFWLNISDPEIDIPGFIEYSNLNPVGEHIIYAPYYMPGDHPDFQQPDSVFIERVRSYLLRINPELQISDIVKIQAGRYRFAQPICPPKFLQTLPPISPGIDNLIIADTSYYYPEDRSISESVKLGKELAKAAQDKYAQ
ncbi:MAG: NAD(P)/FAD-dependent oxidoreductase [Pseudomonadales bacterium]